jgi:hypothetical protein
MVRSKDAGMVCKGGVRELGRWTMENENIYVTRKLSSSPGTDLVRLAIQIPFFADVCLRLLRFAAPSNVSLS